MNPQYKKTAVGWQFKLQGEDLLFEAKEIAILYRKNEDGTATVHRHGPKKTVEEELTRFQETYRNAGLTKEADAHHMVDITNAEENALNHVITTSLLPEEKILALKNPNPFTVDLSYPVPLTRDLGEIQKHLIFGGKILSSNLLENQQRAVDLALLLKEAGAQSTDPKDFTHELIVWPDGTEIAKDDFDSREWEHMSDDHETVLDMDEEMRDYFQRHIASFFQKKGVSNKIIPLPNPEAKVGKPLPTESKALGGLPRETPKKEYSHKNVTELGEKEATIENEEAHRNAKRSLARDAVALNLPPDRQWHHIPLYKDLAAKKILAAPEPAETSNIRLQILDREIELNAFEYRGEKETAILARTSIEKLAQKLAPKPEGKKAKPTPEPTLED